MRICFLLFVVVLGGCTPSPEPNRIKYSELNEYFSEINLIVQGVKKITDKEYRVTASMIQDHSIGNVYKVTIDSEGKVKEVKIISSWAY